VLECQREGGEKRGRGLLKRKRGRGKKEGGGRSGGGGDRGKRGRGSEGREIKESGELLGEGEGRETAFLRQTRL